MKNKSSYHRRTSLRGCDEKCMKNIVFMLTRTLQEKKSEFMEFLWPIKDIGVLKKITHVYNEIQNQTR